MMPRPEWEWNLRKAAELKNAKVYPSLPTWQALADRFRLIIRVAEPQALAVGQCFGPGSTQTPGILKMSMFHTV